MIGVRSSDKIGNKKIRKLIGVCKDVDEVINENTMK